MTEKQRRENQKHYLECCRREGWLDKDNNHLWPEDPEARADMGRGLFGLALTNALDSIFLDWNDLIFNPKGRTKATPGSIVDQLDKHWRSGFASMTEEQKDFVVQVIDDLLDSVAYKFAITLDRFDHGNLSLHLTAVDDQQQPKFTVQIQPHGFLEMFQDVLGWRDQFGRGSAIGRPTSEEEEV